jgi:raffinose/stachyose/melibiose transport system substrate-binding protein
MGMRRGTMAALLALLVALVVAACGGTPGSDNDATTAAPAASDTTAAPAGSTAAAEPTVQMDGFESLGPVELNVWSYDNQDPGLMPVIQELTKQFMAKYPNVKINIEFKDFNSLVDTVNRALASDNGPDITEGNQGYQIDAAQVKAKLIIPLDPYVKAYGWDKWWGQDTNQIFQWTEDGKTFGQGPTWGIAQTGQNVGLYVNKKKLADLGLTIPATFAEFDTMLADAKSKLGDDPIFEFGNKEGYGTIHFIGGLQGAYGDAQPLRDWIYHVPGSTFETPQNIQALTKLAEWGKAGYFNKDYNAVGYDQAAAEFAKGKGLFFVGGNWETAIIKAGLGTDAGMINMPPGESGKHVGVGATSGPWHISAKTKYPDVAAAWLNYIHSSPEAVDLMYKALQIPAISGTTPPADDPFLGEVTASWQQLVSDGGLTLYADWASPSMYDTLAKYYQEAMAGKTSPEDAAKAIQADWTKFDAELQAG